MGKKNQYLFQVVGVFFYLRLIMVVAGNIILVTIHIQQQMTFYDPIHYLFCQRSPVDLVYFSIRLSTYLQVLCEAVGAYSKPSALLQWSTKDNDYILQSVRGDVSTMGTSNEWHNHFLLDICQNNINWSTLLALKFIFILTSNAL